MANGEMERAPHEERACAARERQSSMPIGCRLPTLGECGCAGESALVGYISPRFSTSPSALSLSCVLFLFRHKQTILNKINSNNSGNNYVVATMWIPSCREKSTDSTLRKVLYIGYNTISLKAY